MITLKAGDLAFYDSHSSGLVPCKVVTISPDRVATVRITAERKAFHRGETWHAQTTRVVPRAAVFTPRGEFFPRIRPYEVQL